MPEKTIVSGPISTGIFITLLWLTVLVGLLFPVMLIVYIPFVVFLKIGLRPLLQTTGLTRLYETIAVTVVEKHDRKYLKKKRSEIDRKLRDKKYRGVRRKNPRLPKNW